MKSELILLTLAGGRRQSCEYRSPSLQESQELKFDAFGLKMDDEKLIESVMRYISPPVTENYHLNLFLSAAYTHIKLTFIFIHNYSIDYI